MNRGRNVSITTDFSSETNGERKICQYRVMYQVINILQNIKTDTIYRLEWLCQKD